MQKKLQKNLKREQEKISKNNTSTMPVRDWK